MGVFLFFVGFLVQAVFSVIILVKAFRVSVGWGLATLFIPFAGLVFVINNWQDTKKAFLGGVGGGVLMVLGTFSIATSPAMQEKMRQAEEVRMAREASPQASVPSEAEEPRASYASAAAPVSYQPPPPTTYTPAYVPSYNPPQPAPAPAPQTDTQSPEDEWRPTKPIVEQVYVDRATNVFYAEKCKKRPENAYRIPRTVALMQGITEASCP